MESKKKIKVYVYGLCDVFYDSYYLEGLKEVFQSFEFNISKFPNFRQNCFALIISDGLNEKKIIIDSRDSDKFNLNELAWCDVYGKVNFNSMGIPVEFAQKIVPIGPSFGIKIWGLHQTIFNLSLNVFRFRNSIQNKKEYVANYWRQFRRLRLSSYVRDCSSDSYVFFTSSIWKKEFLTNKYRAGYIKACKSRDDIDFEGGFAPRKDGNNLEFNDIVVDKRYGFKVYLEKIKKSVFVFNTPAVLSCHGWKLAEFLAMGKMIISTPHVNELPAPLEDNIHLVYVSNLAEMDSAIGELLADKEKRMFIEENAKIYFENYLEPSVVIKKLFYNL